MPRIEFVKAHGTGNDFIIYADPHGENTLTAAQIAKLCDRHFGIGADGLIRAVKTKHLPEGAQIASVYPEAEWFMDYYNGDGSTAEMCGNGVRAYVHYLYTENFITPERRETVTIATRAGIKDVLVGVSGYSVDLGRWSLAENPSVTAHQDNVARPSLGINLGNPHTVVALATAQELENLDLTYKPSLAPEPAHGSNIEFVTPQDPLLKDGVGYVQMRVYERGVGETLSCGTGAVAAALAFRHWGGPQMPNNWNVKVPGGTVGVRMYATEEGEHVSLSGPAEIVYRGAIEI